MAEKKIRTIRASISFIQMVNKIKGECMADNRLIPSTESITEYITKKMGKIDIKEFIEHENIRKIK